MKPVWIIDDDRSIRWVLEKSLTREDIAFKSFASADDALRALSNDVPQVVVSDIRMPGSSGLDFLQTLHQQYPFIRVIIMTAYSDLESAVSAFQGGAFEYLPKPFDINHAVELIRRALEQNRRKSDETEQVEVAADILGQAPSMQEVFRAIGRLSQSHATVLINGESGTGKELVARALHRHSPRADKPFIAINTAAIPKDLLESELFGHERGAFTGAAAKVERYFWMKSAICPLICKPVCCAYCRMEIFIASAGISRSRPMCASSPPPTRTLMNASSRIYFAKTCSIA
jgi:two-component system nitrogen regulation response regulator GlnG